MKILIVHNQYLEPGGEDAVVDSERKMLEINGQEVIYYKRSNRELLTYSPFKRCAVLKNISWSSDTYNEIKNLIKKHKPDLVHIHNIFLLISPSVYYACKTEGLPIVQSLHNYRLLCVDGTFFRAGRICQRCLRRSLWPMIFYGCWRGSRFMTAVLVRGLVSQRKANTMIDRFITLSHFSRDKFIEGGISLEKISIKPNFIDFDPGERKNVGKYAIFIGTLRRYKGILTLLEAWQDIKEMPLKVVGDGQLYVDLIKKYNRHNYIDFLGRLSLKDTIDLIKGSCFIVFPSECYETFGRVIIEAFACGVPVLASDIGSMRELVNDGVNGLLFECGNSIDLREKSKKLISNKALNDMLGKNARKTYESNYSMKKNYESLMRIYEGLLDKRKH